jgi:hypothetical protein
MKTLQLNHMLEANALPFFLVEASSKLAFLQQICISPLNVPIY